MTVPKAISIAIAAAILFTSAVGVEVQAALVPSNLRCAQRSNPLGIGDVNPRLSWQLQSTGQRGETQSADQIQVGSTNGAADLWDSGKVLSAATLDMALPRFGGQRWVIV